MTTITEQLRALDAALVAWRYVEFDDEPATLIEAGDAMSHAIMSVLNWSLDDLSTNQPRQETTT